MTEAEYLSERDRYYRHFREKHQRLHNEYLITARSLATKRDESLVMLFDHYQRHKEES